MFKFLIAMMFTTSIFACNLTQEEKDKKASNGMWSEYSFPVDEKSKTQAYNIANGFWESVKWD